MANYYDILGVSKKASAKEIRQAFRRQARKYHPDLNPGDKAAEEQFKRINEAYEVLSNPESREKYNRYGEQWKHADLIEAQSRQRQGSPSGRTSRRSGRRDDVGFDTFSGLEDLLGQFGRPFGRGGDTATATRIEATLTVPLEEAYSGAKRLLRVPSEGSDRRIEVTLPPGVDTGSVVHVSLDDGNELFITVTVAPHSRFRRQGNDLFAEVQVAFEDAILGGETEFQTLKSRVRLKVPPESQNGDRIRLAGHGMPQLGGPQTRGDLYVTLRPRMPKNLTNDEREMLRQFKELRARGR